MVHKKRATELVSVPSPNTDGKKFGGVFFMDHGVYNKCSMLTSVQTEMDLEAALRGE